MGKKGVREIELNSFSVKLMNVVGLTWKGSVANVFQYLLLRLIIQVEVEIFFVGFLLSHCQLKLKVLLLLVFVDITLKGF